MKTYHLFGNWIQWILVSIVCVKQRNGWKKKIIMSFMQYTYKKK